jgi:uncharacterized damage-inducible protein DinB
MFTGIDAFLRYFDSVHRRALRDVGSLPPEADGWRPPAGEGEGAWSVNTIVGHMAGSRLYFASAYRGEGWISPPPPDVSSRERWLPALEESMARFRTLIAGTPDDWLERRIPMIDSEGTLAGWRLLLMMLEHDVHHRSQLDTYAGLNGWPVPDIFNRSAESIGSLQAAERKKHGVAGPPHAL